MLWYFEQTQITVNLPDWTQLYVDDPLQWIALCGFV